MSSPGACLFQKQTSYVARLAIFFPTHSPIPSARSETTKTTVKLAGSLAPRLPGGRPAAAALTTIGVPCGRRVAVGVGSGVALEVGVGDGVKVGVHVGVGVWVGVLVGVGV